MMGAESQWLVFGFAMTTAGMACALACALIIYVNNCYSQLIKDRNEYLKTLHDYMKSLENRK